MSNFKVGQEVVCVVKTGSWVSDISGDVNSKGPKFGDIYTIDGKCDQGGLIFNVLSPESWDPYTFKPLNEFGRDDMLEEIVELELV